jgi:hypothetical protein
MSYAHHPARVIPIVLLALAALNARNVGAQVVRAPDATTKTDSAGAPATFQRVVFTGRVYGAKGKPQPGVAISLVVTGGQGDTLWSAAYITALGKSAEDSGQGRYTIDYPGSGGGERPARFSLSLARQRVEVEEAMSKHKWVQAQNAEWKSEAFGSIASRANRDFLLHYDPAPPIYTLLLLVPALVGLIAATITMSFTSRREGDAASLTAADAARRAKRTLVYYSFSGVVAWVGTLIWFAAGYVLSDLRTIALFDPSIAVPVLVPVAAFLGVLVYATTRLLDVVTGKGDADPRQSIIELGNRVFIAPYVAVVAILALFRGDFAGPVVPFIAFFTGLWIEPVLKALQAVGEKFAPASEDKGKASDVAAADDGEGSLPTKEADRQAVQVPEEEIRRVGEILHRPPVKDVTTEEQRL